MVLIVEALTSDFGEKFWNFIEEGNYENRVTSAGKPQFFGFTNPKDDSYPKMIELFARTEFALRNPNVLTPVHIDEEVSSLSGILLDKDYYKVLLDGRQKINGLSVLRPEYLILFKAKAYLDLWNRRQAGETIHSSEYKKHKKDILRIVVELEVERLAELPNSVQDNIRLFIESLETEPFDVNTLINYDVSTEEVAQMLRDVFL